MMADLVWDLFDALLSIFTDKDRPRRSDRDQATD